MPGDSPNVVVGLDMRLLKNDYSVVFQSLKEMDQGEPKNNKKFTRMLIIPTDQPGGGMSVQEMINAVNSMIKKFSGEEGTLTQAEIESKMDGLVDEQKVAEAKAQHKSVLDDIRVEIRQLFLFYEKINPLDAEGNVIKEGDTEKCVKNLEYAICIRILTADLFPDEMKNLFELKALTFAVWKTDRKKILDRMSIGNIQDLLE